MADVRMVNIRVWNDTWFRSLPVSARLLFFYLISNRSTHVSGFYEIQVENIQTDTGLTKEQVKTAFKALYPKIVYTENWVCIKNYLRHQNLANNEKVNIAVTKYMQNVPIEIVKKAEEAFKSNGNDNGNDNKRVSIPYPYPIQEKEKTAEKHAFGEFKNVMLTIEEKDKLKTLYGVGTAKKLVDDLSIGLKSKGYKYKDHYATIRNWARRDGIQVIEKPKEKEPERPQTEAEKKKSEEMRSKVSAFVKSGMKKMPKSE